MRPLRRKKADESSSSSSTVPHTVVAPQALQDKAIEFLRTGNFEGVMAMAAQPENLVALQAPHTKLGSRLLCVAAEEGRLDCVDALLVAGVEVDQRDAQHMTAWLHAAQNGHVSIAERLLIAGADAQAIHTPSAANALFLASDRHQIAMVRFLVEKHAFSVEIRNASDETPLWNALKTKRFPLARLLLEHKAEIDAVQASTGMTPLHVAAFAGDAASDTLQFLCDRAADVLARTRSGESALSLAARHGHIGLLEALCARCGSDDGNALVNGADAMGRSPLFAACLTLKEHAVTALLARNADVNATDKWRYSPLTMLARMPPSSSSVTLSLVDSLLAARATVDATDNLGLSPFMHACVEGNLDVARVLLSAKADPLRVDKLGQSVMQLILNEEERDAVVALVKEMSAP